MPWHERLSSPGFRLLVSEHLTAMHPCRVAGELGAISKVPHLVQRCRCEPLWVPLPFLLGETVHGSRPCLELPDVPWWGCMSIFLSPCWVPGHLRDTQSSEAPRKSPFTPCSTDTEKYTMSSPSRSNTFFLDWGRLPGGGSNTWAPEGRYKTVMRRRRRERQEKGGEERQQKC